VPPSDSRPQRCTGSALNIALAIMEASHVGGRMINFIGGPCTIGPGQVVDIKLEMTIRNYYDL
jgi:protein transport protein SEC23